MKPARFRSSEEAARLLTYDLNGLGHRLGSREMDLVTRAIEAFVNAEIASLVAWQNREADAS